MTRFWHALLGLDEAVDALYSPAQIVTLAPQHVTLSASLAAVSVYSKTPDKSRARATFWLNRVDGFFLFWFGQHCHCADAALSALAQLDAQVAVEVGPKLQAFVTSAQALGLEVTP